MNQVEDIRTTNEWIREEKGGLPLLFSPILKSFDWMTHAFTTRHGGESAAPLDSFNLGRHWDTAESKLDAMRNRQKLAESLNIDHQRFMVPSQQHTNIVRWLSESELQEQPNLTGVDGLVSQVSGMPLLLHFADCVPVMLADSKTRTISVIHAGWRGTASGIVSNAVRMLIERGSDPRDIAIAIGPAIAPCCFETAVDVARQLESSTPGASGLINYKNDKAYPDLKAINALQAKNAGVNLIDVSNLCTACNPHIFYSHRQSGGRTGRQGAIACLL